MKPPPLLTMAERGRLALEVYQTVERATESFQLDNVGADLAYLLGAILNDSEIHDGRSMVDWSPDEFGEQPALYHIIKNACFPGHAVWNHIQLEDE